jgi:hypothetical protein
MPDQIIQRIELSDGAGIIVLYDWMSKRVKHGRNLVKIDRDNCLLWTAALPTSDPTDCFVAVEWDGQVLVASTWSGYRVSLNVENGTSMVRAFTK